MHDESDPRTWNTEKTRKFFTNAFEEFGAKKSERIILDMEKVVPASMSARNIARLYASEWVERCLGARRDGCRSDVEDIKSVAMDVYGRFHYLLLVARTRTRKETMKSRRGVRAKAVYGESYSTLLHYPETNMYSSHLKGNKPWEQNCEDTSGAFPSSSTPETELSDADYSLLVMLHWDEVHAHVEAAIARAREAGTPSEAEAKERARTEMYEKYRHEVEAEKRRVDEVGRQ